VDERLQAILDLCIHSNLVVVKAPPTEQNILHRPLG
jgi:hypothetical protein